MLNCASCVFPLITDNAQTADPGVLIVNPYSYFLCRMSIHLMVLFASQIESDQQFPAVHYFSNFRYFNSIRMKLVID